MQANPGQALPKPPRSAVFVRPDTLGDLILFSPTLRCLRAAWPHSRLAVIIRQAYVELAGLLAPGIDWIGTTADVFSQGPVEAAEELLRLQAIAAARAPDLIVGACSHRNWLEGGIAASAPAARHLVLGVKGEDPFFGDQLRRQLNAAAEFAAFSEEAPYSPRDRDWERNYGLAEHLLGRSVEHSPPALTLSPERLHSADRVLLDLKLDPGDFAVCAAAGFANVRLKTWPADRYGAVLGWLRREHGLKTLLVGESAEQPHLEAVRARAGSEVARIWTGNSEQLALLAALLARSRFYFGNDTGAMHLAAALGKPIVAVFGGGTWPRFQPAARQAIVLVHPLPCFGCGWDCAFGDAPCVKAVEVPHVQAALAEVIAGQDRAFYDVRLIRALPEAMIDLMGRAAALARERTAEHFARQRKLDELRGMSEELGAERERLQAACDERLALINRLDGDLRRLLREADAREHVIAELRLRLAE